MNAQTRNTVRRGVTHWPIACVTTLALCLPLASADVRWQEDFNDGSMDGWVVLNPYVPGDSPVSIGVSGFTLRVSGPNADFYSGLATGPAVPLDPDEPFTLRFKFKFASYHWYHVVIFGPVCLTFDKPSINLRYRTPGGWGYLGTQSLSSYCPPNTWLTFRVEVNPATHTYDVYVNDVYRGTADYGTYDSGVRGFRFTEVGGNAPNEADYVAEAYYDDLYIESYEPPPPPDGARACCLPYACEVLKPSECAVAGGLSLDPDTYCVAITDQPESRYVDLGESVMFRVVATGNPPPLYQWRHDGIEIPDATTDTLVLGPVEYSDRGAYDVVLTDACGFTTESQTATLTVTGGDWRQPPDFYGWGEYSHFAHSQIVADDWYCLDDRPITVIRWWGAYTNGWEGWSEPPYAPDSFHVAIWTDVPASESLPWSHPGQVVAEWEIPRLQLPIHPVGTTYHPDHGYATCYQYDFPLPQGQEFQPDPLNHDVYWLSVAATYGECPCVADVNGDGLVNNFDIDPFISCFGQAPVGECAFADIDCDGDVDDDDQSIFICQLTAGWPDPACCGSTGSQLPPFHWGWLTRQPAWNDAAVRITAPTSPTVNSTFVSGQPIQNAEGPWDTAFALLTEAPPELQACCVPGGGCLEVLPIDCLLVHGGTPMGPGTTCATAYPSITQDPTSRTTCLGGTVTFTVLASGAPPLHYQWRHNGLDIPGATGSAYTIHPVAAGDQGTYDCTVSNACDLVISNGAVLTTTRDCGDMNCDGAVNNQDIDPFVLALFHPSSYPVQYPDCDILYGDFTGDDRVNNQDIDGFVAALFGG